MSRACGPAPASEVKATSVCSPPYRRRRPPAMASSHPPTVEGPAGRAVDDLETSGVRPDRSCRKAQPASHCFTQWRSRRSPQGNGSLATSRSASAPEPASKAPGPVREKSPKVGTQPEFPPVAGMLGRGRLHAIRRILHEGEVREAHRSPWGESAAGWLFIAWVNGLLQGPFLLADNGNDSNLVVVWLWRLAAQPPQQSGVAAAAGVMPPSARPTATDAMRSTAVAVPHDG